MSSTLRTGQQAVIKDRNRIGLIRALCSEFLNFLSRSAGIEKQVTRALRLHSRGGIAEDSALPIQALSARLKIVCRARALHPWDEDLPIERQSELFARQCLEDVDGALTRIFQRLPVVDEIDMTIVTSDGRTKIIAGLISRENLADPELASPGMRLLIQGMAYHLRDHQFEPIP